MHKLTNIEAQRVLSALQEGTDNLRLLSYIPKGADEEILGQISGAGYTELTASLQRQWSIEDSLVGQGATLRKLRGGESTDDIEEQIKQSTRQLCRELRQNVTAVEVLQKGFDEERSASILQFISSLNDLKEILFNRFNTTVEEDLKKASLLRDLTERSKSAQDELETLQKSLHVERSEKKVIIEKLEKQMSKLTSELTDLNHSTDNEFQKINNDLKSEVDTFTEDHTKRKEEITNKINSLLPEILKTAEDNKIQEALLRKTKRKLENDVSEVVIEYDNSMQAKRQEIIELEEQATEEAKELKELAEHFDRVEENERRSAYEFHLTESLKARFEDAKHKMDLGAVAIQKLFKGRQTRREMAKLKKGKGGKGGKGGKKKK